MRVLVCGGRDYNDSARVFRVLDLIDWTPGDVLLHGDAKGADAAAASVAHVLGVRVEAYPADWDRYGKAAGPLRNKRMLDTGVDLVIAFPGGAGTEHMKTIARQAGVIVLEVS